MSSATTGTVAGRPQPQTTAETAGGPFVRHAPPGRRAMYTSSQTFGGFIGAPMVSSPGWNRGYRVKTSVLTATGTAGVIATTAGGVDAPDSFWQLVQMKDSFGTQLLTGPGYDIGFLVPLLSGQFGLDLMRSPHNSPIWTGITATSGAWTSSTYLPFEFAKGYGVISGANAALLPVLQINLAPVSTLFSTPPSVTPTPTTQVDADFYWLPNTPADPPGIGTTQQWIYQPCNPTIPSAASQLVQLPRLGGYLSVLGLDLRNVNGARVDDWPTRPKIVVDGVPVIDTDIATWEEDMAISMGIGAGAANTQTGLGTVPVPRPTGVLAVNYKTSLCQRDFGLFDTGETYLSTNPGTQLEINGTPWPTMSNAADSLNAIIGQIVPSGALIRGLPEA